MKFKIGDTVKRKVCKEENYYPHRAYFVWSISYNVNNLSCVLGLSDSEKEFKNRFNNNGAYIEIIIKQYTHSKLLLTERI